MDKEDMKLYFRVKLKELLEKKHFTQTDLAAHLGTSQQTISRYLNGTFIPDCVRIKQIADILECSVTYFYENE